MCGLAGILVFEGPPPVEAVLAEMGASLGHRGPDGQRLHMDVAARPAVGLVHRRLSIIDLSHEADQPLASEDGSVLVALNGEIYNFKELRGALQARHTFRSQGDTEVIVHGYEERGDAIISALDGMFAVVLWDARRRRLLLARDSFGKKPLYYWTDGRRLVFGSEIKALLAAGVPTEMEVENLQEYLALGYTPTPRTLFRGIRRLPPASFMVADSGGVHEPSPYWDLRFPLEGHAATVSPEEAADRVRDLLFEAVRKRLVADVPLGVLLSGGVDSSAVAAITARLVPGRVKTFAVGFEGQAFLDERPYAELVARHIGAEHSASTVTPHAAVLMETLLGHHDEPFGDSSALPTYLVAQEARQHVTVALNGDGGDETFAGYDRFWASLLAEAIPHPLRTPLHLAGRVLPEGAHYHGTLRRIRRFTDHVAESREESLLSWCGVFDAVGLTSLSGNGAVDHARILSSYREAWATTAGASLLSRLLYLNARTYLLDDLLPKMDRMTMAHGLEARSPLLDRSLMEYVAGIPDSLKRRGSHGKLVFKNAVRDLLPPATLRRRKQGFGVPLGEWFRGELRPMVEDTLLAQPRLGAWLSMDAVRGLYQEHQERRADLGHQLWALLTLELWLRKYRFG